MHHCLCRVVVHIAICFLLFIDHTRASSDSTSLPALLTQQLEKFQRNDDLSSWIYARIDYADKDPFERTGFLMATQKASWRSCRTFTEKEAWLNLLILQGYFQLQTGNILASIDAYESAMQFYEANEQPQPLAAIEEYAEFVLRPLGNNYTRLADYNTAFFIHEKTLAIALRNKDRREQASVYLNMAVCARWKGDFDAATRYCRAGIQQTGRDQAFYGLLLNTYADVLLEQNRTDTAAILSAQSLRLLERWKNSTSDDLPLYWYTSALQVAAQIALQQGRYPQATGFGKQALKIFNERFPLTRSREKAKVNVLLGDISSKAGNDRAAFNYYQQALRWLLPSWHPENDLAIPNDTLLYSENTIGDALTGKAAILERTGQPALALQYYAAVFKAARRLRGSFYHTESKLKELALLRSRSDAAMALAWRLWNTTRQPEYRDRLLLIAEWSKAQLLLDERSARAHAAGTATSNDSLAKKMNKLQHAIIYYQHELMNFQQGTTTYKDPATVRGLLQSAEYELSLVNKTIQRRSVNEKNERILTAGELPSMLALIPANTSILEFFEGADNSYILELSSRGLQAVHLVENTSQLRAVIPTFMQQWFSRGPSAMINNPAGFYRQCASLYNAIFHQYSWQKGKHYILAPDGIFNYLPFDALLTDTLYKADINAWPYLFKQVSLSQAYSLQTWYEQQSALYTQPYFGAFFVSKGQQGNQPALSVEKEYSMLQPMMPGRYFYNAASTWQAFNQVTDSLRILHIATHAVSSSGDSFPYLQLYDRPFYLFDLRYKNFSPALVVLGACKTADGNLMEGEGVNSLGRGFVAAGAGGVVSGLWNLNDETAIAIVQSFYENLHKGQSPALALYHAKQQWLEAHVNDPILQLPYYWAGFMYSGHLQPVSMEGSKRAWPYYMAVALLMVAIVVIIINSYNKKRRGYS